MEVLYAALTMFFIVLMFAVFALIVDSEPSDKPSSKADRKPV